MPVPPDAVASASGIVKPTQTAEGPVIVPATGDTFTVTLAVVVTDPQKSVLSVNVIVVKPGLTP